MWRLEVSIIFVGNFQLFDFLGFDWSLDLLEVLQLNSIITITITTRLFLF